MPHNAEQGAGNESSMDTAAEQRRATPSSALEHLHLIVTGGTGFVGSGQDAAVAGADLPDQVSAGLEVVRRDAALAGVVGKAAHLGTAVEGQDRVGAQAAVAHRADVQKRALAGLAALAVAEGDSRGGTVTMLWAIHS